MLALSFVAPALQAQTTPITPGNSPREGAPRRDPAPRIVVPVRGKRDVLFDEPVTAVTVIDSELVAAEKKGAAAVTFTGLAQGETMVIVSGRSGRRAVAVEVRERASETAEQIAARAARRQRTLAAPAGTLFLSFTPASGGSPALLRQSFEMRRKLAHDRTLFIESDTYKFFGGERGITYPTATGLGVNRLVFGVESPEGRLDLLDNELNISPLGLNGYTMRGLHLASAPDSRLRGVELFAGLARPSTALFEHNEGFLSGALLPLARGKTWRVRGGVMALVPRGRLRESRGGVVWQADGRYAPDERTAAEGEVAYANGGLSWRARLDLQRGAFNFYGESSRLDRRSPFIGIGAQSGGRRLDAFSLGWRPASRLNATLSYHRAATAFATSTQRATLDSSALTTSINYLLTRKSRVGFQLTRQVVETTAPGLSTLLRLETRGAIVNHSIAFGNGWGNDFEVGLTASREAGAGTGLERGLRLREELRRTFGRWSAAGYFNHASNTPSLASLIVRNPELLPPVLRRAYELDPSRFLIENRDGLRSLLGGVELPAARTTDVGARLQGAFSRYNLTSEVRYSAGEILSRGRRNLLATVGVDVRLDASNFLQVTASRNFAPGVAANSTGLTVSYRHFFGGGSREGFQFSGLFGWNRGRIEGRVFLDLNGDGRDDPNEPGLAGMKVQVDGDHGVTTDARGRFRFTSMRPGAYNVALISGDLGVRLRATTETEQRLSLSGRRTIKVDFGVTNHGFVAGRVFNDLHLKGEEGAANAPGVGGVRLTLRAEGTGGSGVILAQTVDASGMYEFRNLAPGSYRLAIDPLTLPADFRIPAQTYWTIKVEPLQGSYVDIPLAAQRAVFGIVFLDKDGDGQFDPQRDEAAPGARVVAGRVETRADARGYYMLRNLPAGVVEVRASLPRGSESQAVKITLDETPDLSRTVNLALQRMDTSASLEEQ